MDRRLSLRSERLTELTADELGSVAGAAPPTLNSCEIEVTTQVCWILSLDCLTGHHSIGSPCTR